MKNVKGRNIEADLFIGNVTSVRRVSFDTISRVRLRREDRRARAIRQDDDGNFTTGMENPITTQPERCV